MGAVLSTLGSESALVLVGPRILYAFAQAGQLPAAFARIHSRYRTPHVAVLVFSGAAWAAALTATFAELATVSAIARLLFSAATCLAIPVLRRKMPPAPFRVPGGLLVPLAAATISIWLLSGMSRAQTLAGAVALAVGLALYAVIARPGAAAGRS